MRRRQGQLRAAGGSRDRPRCSVLLGAAESVLLGLREHVRAVCGRLLCSTGAAPVLAGADECRVMEGALVEGEEVRNDVGEGYRFEQRLDACEPAERVGLTR